MKPGRKPTPVEDRFWNHLQVTESGCWGWDGPTIKGYPAIKHGNSTVYMSRYSYEMHKGPIPDKHVVRHTCDNPICCNPEHLVTGTYADNSRDMVQRGRWKTGTKRKPLPNTDKQCYHKTCPAFCLYLQPESERE